MGKRFARFLSAPLRLPLWLALALVFGGLGLLAAFDVLGVLPDEQGMLIFFWFAFVVVYFPIRICWYYRTREVRMREILGIVAAFHALALADFFWGPQVVDLGRSMVAELIGLDFWVFPAIFLATWGYICVLIASRYDKLGRFDATRAQVACAIGTCAVLLLFAIGAQSLVPGFRPVYASFGADLPRPTLFSFAVYQYWYAIPLLGAILAGCVLLVSSAQVRARRIAFDVQIGLLVFSNLAMVATVDAMFLPVGKTCGSFRDHAQTGFTRLHAAAYLGRTESVVRWMAGGKPVDLRDRRGVTPLMYSAGETHLAAARALLAGGADVNVHDESGKTALQMAVTEGEPGQRGLESLELVGLLLERGARVNAARDSGDTALHVSAWRGRADVATLLLAKGADVNALAVDGTPLDVADLARHPALVSLLLQHGAVRATKAQKEVRKRNARTRAVQAGNVASGSCGGRVL